MCSGQKHYTGPARHAHDILKLLDFISYTIDVVILVSFCNAPTGDTPVNLGQHTTIRTVSQEAPAGLGRESPPTLQSVKSVRSQCLLV